MGGYWRAGGARAAFVAYSAFLAMVVYMRHHRTGCVAPPVMWELTRNVAAALDKGGFHYWLDFGSLLGLVRDRDIIPWEFDVDMSVLESECDRLALEAPKLFAEYGYTAVPRGQYMWQKRWSHFYDPTETGTLRAPCVRVYVSGFFGYYADIYWYREVKREEMPAPVLKAYEDYDDPLWLCMYDSLGEDDPGGCKPKTDILPLGTDELRGVKLSVPHHPVNVLAHEYGPTFMKPRPKGYKALVCAPSAALDSLAVVAWLLALLGLVMHHSVAVRHWVLSRLPCNKGAASLPLHRRSHVS